MIDFSIDVIAPSLSVVVVALNAPSLLGGCLEALRALGDDGLEVLVVRDWDGGGPDGGLRRAFPGVRWMAPPPGATVPVMRWVGMKAARAPVVATIEDDCLVQPGWSDAIRLSHAGPAVATGGAVEPGAYRSALDWAVYFCDYGRFMPPLPAHDTADLAGMNVAYKRDVLQAWVDPADGFHDLFVHRAWQHEGRVLRSSDAFVVRNVNTWQARHVTSWPYHHGRAFAARRFAGAPPWRRAGFAVAAALVVPWLKTCRVGALVITRRRHRAAFVRALPCIVLFQAAWAFGEAIGSVFGGGRSADAWR